MKENLEKAWTMMILLHCSLAAIVVAIIAVRFFVETFTVKPEIPHLLDLHWGAGLSIAALIALRIVWRSKSEPACSFRSSTLWRVRAGRATDFSLLLSALLIPASGVSMVLWNGQDIEWLGQILIAAGPKNTDLRNLSLIVHEVSVVFLALSLAGHLILVLTRLEQKRS